MQFVILYTDGSTELAEAEDYIEVKCDRYVDVDGELYGATGPVDVERVTLAESERPIDA